MGIKRACHVIEPDMDILRNLLDINVWLSTPDSICGFRGPLTGNLISLTSEEFGSPQYMCPNLRSTRHQQSARGPPVGMPFSSLVV